MFPFFDTEVRVAAAMLALYGLLAAASLSIKLAAKGAAPRMLSHQVNAWWRIFPIITLTLLCYPTGLPAFACLVYLFACLELKTHYDGQQRTFWIGAIAIVVLVVVVHWWLASLAPVLVACAIAIQALGGRYRSSSRQLVWSLMAMTGGAMYIVAVFPSLPLEPQLKLAWLFYLFVLTALNDIGQFVAGKLFGRHKIAPTISPNKTWQGLAGGIAVSQIVSLTIGSYLSLATASTLVIFALLLSIIGFVGDLMFSAAKRRLAIKDFSALILGHGGILDRVDSLVLTAPLLYFLLCNVE
jgi:phosphatidate cytidylyltransferase